MPLLWLNCMATFKSCNKVILGMSQPNHVLLGKWLPVPTGQTVQWVPKPVWSWHDMTRKKILLYQGSNPSCPVHRQSFYWLSYSSSQSWLEHFSICLSLTSIPTNCSPSYSSSFTICGLFCITVLQNLSGTSSRPHTKDVPQWPAKWWRADFKQWILRHRADHNLWWFKWGPEPLIFQCLLTRWNVTIQMFDFYASIQLGVGMMY